jgi:HSP20 family molecular chaperone IbpA
MNTQSLQNFIQNLIDEQQEKINLIKDGTYVNDVWSYNEDGSMLFELEVPRYSKNEISVTIEGDSEALTVVGKKEKNGFKEEYRIPNYKYFDLDNCLAKVEDGLLSIAFPMKVAAKTAIKIL